MDRKEKALFRRMDPYPPYKNPDYRLLKIAVGLVIALTLAAIWIAIFVV